MDKGYQKEQFTCLSIKVSIAKKYRKFCRTLGKSQSMTLLDMIDFFEVNEVSPNDRLGETISSLKYQIKKRFNGVVAIIKNIEKTHHKPTTAILQTLFEETSNIEKEEEIFDFETPTLITEKEELTYYRNEYYTNQENYNALKYDVEDIIKKTKYIKSNFSTGYFRLEITKEEFEQLKQQLKDVHHHNSTEIGR
ncbi:MAG: BfmA/BtgA family mobilization protein [Urechidicola sp.]|nr:BfmA/BtgA family mobilization protein [Urechidicola sp.]